MKTLIGKKVGMTNIFDDAGNMIPVTVIEAGPCVVTQLKNLEKDGYNAVQLGFGEAKKPNRPMVGHTNKSGIASRVLKEFHQNNDLATETEVEGEKVKGLKVGDKLTLECFSEGDIVSVSGISKGKGFAGTIKRHNFHRGPKTHGSGNYREPGSMGAMFPQHVMKGKKLPGRMGCDNVTVKSLKVMRIDKENNIIAVRGAIPGPKKGIVLIKG
jgi:large subunit ribosomal protein L3